MKLEQKFSHAPLADALIELNKKREITSFHALPLFGGGSIANCDQSTKYRELFGDAYLGTEITFTGRQFDSFFFAEGVIKEAEQLAASLFSADGTLFVTTGTTTSNQIAIHAFFKENFRVLLDRQCHQSMHFTLHSLGAEVEYLLPVSACELSGRNHWCLDDLLNLALAAQESGRPYDLIILNAQSYDGIIYSIPDIIAYHAEAWRQHEKLPD